MTNFTKEIKKFNFKSGSIWDFRYAFNSLIWDIEAERNRSEDNGDFDKAVEMYTKEIEVKKIVKELDEIYEILTNKEALENAKNNGDE